MGIPNRKYFNVKRRRGEAPVSQTPLENPENPLNPDGSGGGALPHNSTTGKQGGDPVNDFFGHVTEEELDMIQNLPDPAPQGDRVINGGVHTFPTSTSLNSEDVEVIISDVLLDTTPIITDPIEGTPVEYNRTDSIYMKSDGTIGYIAGYEDPEGSVDAPPIPTGTVLLATVLRTPLGDNTVYVTPEDLTDFVSKSDPNLQTLESFLGFKKMIADDINKTAPIRSAIFNQNGRLSAPSSPTIVDVFTTQQGATNYSKILTIDATVQNTRRYKVPIEVSGVNGMEGQVWTQIEIDVNGDMLNNTLLTFGNIDPTRFKLVKVGAKVYELYVSHLETDDFFKYRPLFSFGSSDKYVFAHLTNRVPLPSGDVYDYEVYGEGTSLDSNIVDALQAASSPATANPFATINDIPTPISEFINLDDTPNDYTGQGGKKVKVKASEDGLEFVDDDGGVGADTNAVHYDSADGKSASEKDQARQNIGSVDSFSGRANQVVVISSDESKMDTEGAEELDLSGIVGKKVFTALEDTFASMSGRANEVIVVNNSENELDSEPTTTLGITEVVGSATNNAMLEITYLGETYRINVQKV